MEQSNMTAHDTAATSLKRTPLYEQHLALGARLVEFGGWEMPVQYSSILEEHRAVRTRAGLFDVSHMGEFKVEGKDALAFLQYLVPNDVGRLAIHQALYSQLCLPDGGIIDDLIIYYLAENHYMMVVNAANIDKDFAWVEKQARNFDVQATNQSDATALLALQGPESLAILQPNRGGPLRHSLLPLYTRHSGWHQLHPLAHGLYRRRWLRTLLCSGRCRQALERPPGCRQAAWTAPRRIGGA